MPEHLFHYSTLEYIQFKMYLIHFRELTIRGYSADLIINGEKILSKHVSMRDVWRFTVTHSELRDFRQHTAPKRSAQRSAPSYWSAWEGRVQSMTRGRGDRVHRRPEPDTNTVFLFIIEDKLKAPLLRYEITCPFSTSIIPQNNKNDFFFFKFWFHLKKPHQKHHFRLSILDLLISRHWMSFN